MENRLSYEHGTSQTPLLGETIGDNLVRTAGRFPDHEALVDCPSGRRWTYSELLDWSKTVAKGLLASGVTKGDRVGIWSPNCPEWVAVQYATALIGAILVNINPAYRLSELDYVLRQSGVRTLVSATTHKTSDYRQMAEEVGPGVSTLLEVVYIGDATWNDLERAGEAVTDAELAAASAGLAFDDPINIQYTSGTTGFPKGATLSHHNILNNAYFVAELLEYTHEDRVCLPVPFYHCFGMVMGNLGSTTHGSTIVIPAPSFDPVATLEAVQRERCTSLYGVPTMFIAELGVDGFSGYDLTSLRTGIMAGSPCPVEVMKRVINEMHMTNVGIAYGMTETSPVSTQTRADDGLERRTATVGRAMPHVEIKVVDPATGVVVPRGIPGEFCTRGYSVMLGYWDEPSKTADAIDAGRWMHTGDLAVMREDGYVNIVGRIKDMVIRGGENIYPREIEEFLYSHPDIEDVAVIGVPDDRYGEELMAWVRLRPGAADLDAASLRDYCQGRIAHHKIPRYVRVSDSFPMTVTGKVRKVEMREISIAELGLESAAGIVTA
ncbi:MAG TPA: AMP-binding protein [Acidimicrobiales bacterium]|nr:AMP-binding protein [Acidimicrobiales bacterium]